MNAVLKNWWILTIKGLLTFLSGLIVISSSINAHVFIVNIFGIFLLISGSLLTYLSLKEKRKYGDKEWKLTEGFIDLIIGLIIISFAEMTTSVFLSLVTIWISFIGILQISNGRRLRGLYNHYWFLIFNGLLAIGFAGMTFTYPYHGLITMMILIGLQATVFIGFLIISSVYIRKIFHDIDIEIPHKEGDEANQELSYY